MHTAIKYFFSRTAFCLFALTDIFFFLPSSSAQDISFRFDKITSENIKIEKGLSVNAVSCILQDNIGYMWFGTWDGLNKFDGYKFIVYKANEFAKNNELSNQFIHAIYQDKEGNIWIGTENGLNKFQYNKQTFIQFKHNYGNTNCLSSDTVWSIYEDSYDKLWIGTHNGLNLFDKKTGKFIQFHTGNHSSNTISNNKIKDIVEDNLGCIWLATEKGLNRYNPLSKKFTAYFHDPKNINSLNSDTIWSVFQDKKGFIWIGTENGLCKFDMRKESFTRFQYNSKDPNSISGNHISDVFEDSKGTLWIGTFDNGINIFDRGKNKFIRYQNIINDYNSLSNNNVSSIYEDKSGIVWIATSKGVNKINGNSYKFLHFQHTKNDAGSLNNNIVWAFHEDKDGNLWIGTDNGLNFFNRKSGKFKVYKNDPANNNSISGNVIKAIISDKDGDIWIGTESAGVDEFITTENGKYQKINIKNSLCDNTVWCLHQDKYGYIWIGTNNGLNRYNKKTGELKSYKHNPYNPYSLSNNIINVIFEDKTGVLWFGTYNGLNKYDKKTEKFFSYKHIPNDSTSISSNRIFGIFEDKNETMWLGTMNGGLNKFDRKIGKFKNYTEDKNGLANNMVYCILEDNNGNLWLTTNGGISKFNIKTETFVNYDVKDGVQSSEFNQNAAIKTKDGEFFFGGMNGFNAFYPQDIKQNKFIPPIVITSFKKFNEIQKKEINDGDTIILSYKDNFFSFEFSALDYSNPIKNKYAYKLERFDKEWIYCDANRRYAEYTKVSPGIYKFRVKGTNCDGVWNNEGISFTIIITPPWWATWTFRIPFLIFLIFIGWYFINRRFRLLRKKHEIEKKVLEIEKQLFDLEQTALRLQMNPHFIFNSLNSIQSFIVNNDSEKATLYLAKFAQLMRLILSNSSESFVPIKDEMKALAYYMDIENLRFDNKFDYKIKIDPEIDEDFIGIPPMVIQPYVENAILHGIINKNTRGKIFISLSLQSDTIMCVIEDDGVGREKAMEIKNQSGFKHKSRGMIITKERLEILNKQTKGRISVNVIDLKDENGNALGTKVEIVIPFKEI